MASDFAEGLEDFVAWARTRSGRKGLFLFTMALVLLALVLWSRTVAPPRGRGPAAPPRRNSAAPRPQEVVVRGLRSVLARSVFDLKNADLNEVVKGSIN